MLDLVSLVGVLAMVGGAVGLYATGNLFSTSPLVITVQAAAAALMIWARVTFGFRSFHAAANPTEGGLVTSGPYRFIRHPIYTAVCLFVWAGALAHLSYVSAALAVLALIGSLARMLAEEHMLVVRYPEYREYAAKTKRMLPHVF
ncbi:MAG: methyltransferase family protein [Thermoanaerobaculales bacterium]